MGFGRWLRSLYIIYPDWLWIFWHCVCCFKLVWISLSNKSIRTLYAAIEWNGSLESNIGRISNRKLFFKTRMAWIHCNEVYLQGKNSCSGTTYITMFRSDWVLHSVFEGFHCNTYPHTHTIHKHLYHPTGSFGMVSMICCITIHSVVQHLTPPHF